MNEYYVHCGNYRKFIVIADSIEQARQRFIEASKTLIIVGFKEQDITSISPKL